MFFKKNKIAKNIKESSNNQNQSADFESLSVINQNRFINKVKKKVKQEYTDGLLDIKDKYKKSLVFLKTYWFLLFKILLILFLITTIIYGSLIAFEPYFAGIPGINWTPLNLFYLAKYTNNNITFTLSNLAIGFVIIFALTIILSIFYFIWSIKIKRFKDLKKSNLILLIFVYICILIAILLLVIPIFITPSFSASEIQGQKIYSLIETITNNKTNATAMAAIKELYAIVGLSVPSGDPQAVFNDFSNNLTNGIFERNTEFNNYSFIQDVYSFTASKLNTIGIVFLVLIILFFVVGIAILPFSILIINMFRQYYQNENVVSEWNGFKIFIFNFINKIKNIFMNFHKLIINMVKKHKNKDTFRKYKKHLAKDQNIKSKDEQFSTEAKDNAKTNVITKQEIELHEPNKAFLNNQGQWMYHDGKGKYFIVKNDEWIPYDVNASIHIAHVNINNDKNEQMSKKTIKESKLFKKSNNRMDNLANKSKQEVLIDLPDEELDQIIKDLDI